LVRHLVVLTLHDDVTVCRLLCRVLLNVPSVCAVLSSRSSVSIVPAVRRDCSGSLRSALSVDSENPTWTKLDRPRCALDVMFIYRRGSMPSQGEVLP